MEISRAHTIHAKILFWLVVASLIPLALITYINYKHARETIENQTRENLAAIAERQVYTIDKFIGERLADIRAFAQFPILSEALMELENAFFTKGSDSPEYSSLRNKYGSLFEKLRVIYDYKNIYLVSKNGDAVFSAVPGEIAGSNLFSGPLKTTELPELLRKVLETRKPEISSFTFYPQLSEFAAFAVAPISRGADPVGAIVLRLNPDNIFENINDYYIGMGETGETALGALIGQEVVFVAPLRFNPEAAFKVKAPLGPGTALPMQNAVLRKNGQGYTTDYRGKLVWANWRYLPSMKLGMVVKMDVEEAFAPAEKLKWFSFYVATATLALAMGIAIYVSRSIADPIQRLSLVTKSIAGGNLSQKAVIREKNEIGELAESFNKMTERLSQSYNELKKTNEDLERSNRELDDFAYIVSHDLKEPLRGIHNYSSFLVEDYHDKLDDDGRKKLDTLVRLSQRLEHLINDVLYYSRVGRSELFPLPTDLNAVVEDIRESLQTILKENGVELRMPWRLPTVECDPTRAGEIFHNLIVNAAKYNDKAEKWIEIGCVEPGEKTALLEIGGNGETNREASPPIFYVRDNGIGVPEKHLDSIFRIFKRLHGRDKFGGGTGVGLTIAKKLVERHGGKIWAESMVGEGTTFYFTLQRDHHDAS